MNKKLYLLLTIFAVFLAAGVACAAADTGLNPQEYTLPNGMRVLLIEEHSYPTATVQIFVKTGSINETSRTNGLSHVCEHLYFRNSSGGAAEPFKIQLEGLGAFFNGQTTKDYTCYYATFPSQSTKKILELMARAYLNFNFSQSDFENEKKIVLNEYNISKDDIMTNLINKLDDTAFPNHPYKRSVIGTESTITSFTSSDALSYQKKYYTPANTTLILAGDFNSSEILNSAKELFKNFKGDSPGGSLAVTPFVPYSNQESVEEKDLEKYYMVLGYKTPGAQDASDICALDVISFMLGQGEDCMLYRTLVKEKKLVEDVGLSFLTSKDPGILYIVAVCDTDKFDDAKKEIFNAINAVKSGNFSDGDLVRAKNYLLNTYMMGLETNQSKAQTLGFYDTISSYRFACSYPDKIKKINKDDIIQAANNILGSSYFLIVYKPKYIKPTPADKEKKKKDIPWPLNIFNW